MHLEAIIDIARKAGKAIMEIYSKDFSYLQKEDKSPLTEADTQSNQIICDGLQQFGLPILSEENKIIPYEERKQWQKFWLVDPLDGTKEFIKRNGNFTVNIALLENNTPILGVIYVPTKEILYYGDSNGAVKEDATGKYKLPVRHEQRDYKVVVASQSHMNQETKDYVHKLGNCKLVSIGSSLKFCLVAEGTADIYPRLGPTMEWDTAAAHAIIKAAGKKVYIYDSEQELAYNKPDLHNPYFIVK